jgi:hypothetical protein
MKLDQKEDESTTYINKSSKNSPSKAVRIYNIKLKYYICLTFTNMIYVYYAKIGIKS